jgi:predicted esterase
MHPHPRTAPRCSHAMLYIHATDVTRFLSSETVLRMSLTSLRMRQCDAAFRFISSETVRRMSLASFRAKQCDGCHSADSLASFRARQCDGCRSLPFERNSATDVTRFLSIKTVRRVHRCKRTNTPARHAHRHFFPLFPFRCCVQVFRTRLDRLSKRCASRSIMLAFVDAPFVLPLQQGQDVPMRCWFRDGPRSSYQDDVASALDVVASAWRSGHPFCGVVAFSQGAAVAHEALLRGDDVVPGCSAVFLAGGCVDRRSSHTHLKRPVASMHAMGARDTAVPPSVSRELSALFGDRAQVLEHDQGHCVPGRAPDLDRIADWLDANLVSPPLSSRATSAGGTAHVTPSSAESRALSSPSALPSALPSSRANGDVGSCDEPDEAHAELQNDEVSSLESIYDSELNVLSRRPFRVAVPVALPRSAGASGGAITIEFEMPAM